MKYNYIPIILFFCFFVNSNSLFAQLTVNVPGGFELNDDTNSEGLKCTDPFTVFTESSFIATDDCPGDPVIDISTNITTTGCFQTYTVTAVISNDCGEAQTWESDFNRIDENQNPVLLDIPADFEEFFDSTPTVLDCTDPFPTYTVADFPEVQGCGFIRNAVINETPFANGCFESLYITYTVEDECLNVRQFAAQYDRPINPLTPPTITTALTEFLNGAATQEFITCDAILPPAITEADFTATVAGDAACSSNVTTSLDFKEPTNDGCTETFIVEYIATDACENSDTLTATYTRPYNDGLAPDVTLPVGYEVGFFGVDTDNSASQLTCLEVAPVFDEDDFEANSNCALYPATGTLLIDNETTTCDEITTYTYTAADICGNSITYQAIFNAKKPETVPPVVIEGADNFEETADGTDTNPVLLNCNDEFPDITSFNESNFLYADGCTPNSALILSFTTSGEIDNGCYLEETFTFTAEDLCGNINDSWVSTYIKPKPTDVTPPTITFNTPFEPVFANGADPDTLLTCTEAFPEFTDLDFSAEDDCIVFPIEVGIETNQEFSDDGCTEILTVTISAVDYCDNETAFDAVFVRFVDNGDVIVNVPTGFEQNDDATIDNLGCDAAFNIYTIADFSAGNTCDAGIVVNNVNEDLVTIGCVEYQTITYTVEDYCGNNATYVGKFSRHITDNVAPTVVAPTGFVAGTTDPTATIIQGCGIDFPIFVDADFTPTDNCGIANVELNSTDETSADSCFETRTFTYTATDTCGLSTTYTGAFTILADNTTPPTVIAPNSPINAGVTDFVEGTATAINLENCGDALPTYDVATFNVTDDCGLLKSVVLDTLDETSTCFNTRTFTLTAIDTCDNAISFQAIYNSIIDDNLPPTIVAPADFENGVTDAIPTVISCGETPSFTIADFDETNGCGEEISELVAPVVITNDGCLETLIFTYTAEDTCGDIATYTASFQKPLNEIEVEFIEPTSICPDGTYTVQALGGFGCAGGDFNFVLHNAFNDVVVDNATGFGATNVTFTGIIPGIYYVVVTDNTDGCEIESITKTVFGLLDGEFTPSCGANYNTFTINNLSGGSDNYNVISDIDGILDNAVAGNYQPTQTLTAGVHTITITDNAIGTACELIFTIEVFDELMLEASPEDCSFNGTVNVATATGGASGYTIFPSTSPAPNATNDIISNETSLTATGTLTGIASTTDFYIVLEDGNGCQVSQLISVIALPELTNELTFNCSNTNQVSVAVTGGTAPWNFYLYETGTAFDNGTSAIATLTGGTTANFSGVAGGAYTIYAVDDNGCESSSVDVEVFDELALEIAIDDCTFNNTLEVTLVSGGTDPSNTVGGGFVNSGYTIFLASDENATTGDITSNEGTLTGTGNFTGIDANADFYVILQDANGCQIAELIEYAAAIDIENNLNQACNDAINEVNVSVTGGNVDWDFYLFEADASYDASNPSVGSIATDAGDGSGSDTNGNFTGVNAGAYYLAAADTDGCTADTVAVFVYDELAVGINLNSCFFDGSVEVTTISGGTDPTVTIGGGFSNAGYTVFLSSNDIPNAANNITSNEGTLAGVGNFTGVATSTDFYVIVEDGNGCQTSELISVGEQATLTNNLAEDCVANVNAVSVSANGGSPDWTFYLYAQGVTFDDGTSALATDAANGSGTDTQGDFADVLAGTYTVYATDANDCEIAPIDVTVTDELTLEIDFASCNFNGEIEVTAVTGGTAPYTITLSNNGANEISLNDTGTFTGIVAGVFDVILEDENGCEFTVPVDINSTGELVDNTADCVFNTINVAVNGGVSNYDFYVYPQGAGFDDGDSAITSSTGGTTTNFTDVDSGNYTIYATANDGCDELTVDVYVFDEIIVEQTDLCVYGTITVTASGGFSTNYTYSISDGAAPDNTTGIFENLPAGSYIVTVSDDNPNGDCPATFSVQTFEPISVDANQVCYEGITVTGGQPDYTYDLYEIDGTTLVGSNTTGVFADTGGDYILIVTDANGCDNAPGAPITCEPETVCDLEYTTSTTCVDGNSFTVEITLTAGTGNWLITDDINPPIIGTSAGDVITTQAYPNGNYAITIISQTDPNCIFEITGNEDCTPYNCELNLTENVVCNADGSFTVDITFGGEGTFIIDELDGTQQTNAIAGAYTFGPYAAGTTYGITVTSNEDDTCTGTIGDTPYCCSLNAVANAVCVDESAYTVEFTIDGEGTFTVDDGNGTIQNGISAGVFTTGVLPNGNYTITITSEDDPTCSQELTVENDCFECDLETTVTTTCEDAFNFTLDINITGSGTYIVDDGINTPTTGVTTGTFAVGVLPNGAYNVTITSELNEDCSTIVSGTEDCFECDLEVSASTNCIDGLNYELSYTIIGTGTFTVDDGINPVQTGVTAGTFVAGNLPNGAYSITVTNEFDDTCTTTAAGEEDCFECPFPIDFAVNCLDDFTFEVVFTYEGEGTFSMGDGINPVQTGLDAAVYTVGPFNNGNYNIELTSENNPDCVQTISGTKDCFECDLEVTTAFECVDILNYELTYTIVGTGTFTVNDGVNPTQMGVVTGTYTVGTLPNGPYSITVTSETDVNCSETINGENDCFECELDFQSSTVCNDNGLGYTVTYTITGADTYIVEDGINGTQTNIGAGTYTVSYPNGAYTILITSETKDACSQTISGSEDCFECDLTASVTAECIDLFNYNLSFTIAGTGTFTINDGVNPIQTGVAAGTYVVGTLQNGAYSILITSETDSDCSETLSGEQDCFECELDFVSNTVCNDNGLGYTVTYIITGSDTYIVENGVNSTQTNISAGTYTVNYPNGAYTILITSETNAECTQTISGNEDCFECELDFVSNTVCNDDGLGYTVTYTITGSDTYIIENGVNGTQTNISAGTYTVAYPNGAYSILITSETNAECTQTISGEEDCFECDLTASATAECVDLFNYNLSYTITGTGTFTVNDGVNPIETGVVTGTYTVGTLVNGSYSILITSETDADCSETLAGEQDCFECELDFVSNTVCNDDGLGYTVTYTITGSDTYTIVDGVNATQTNIGAGTYVVAYPNGGYSIVITSETNAECTQTISGEEDCFECELNISPSTECNEDGTGYTVTYSLNGTDTYIIEDGVNGTQTNVGVGTYTVNYPNGAYSIVITSETDADCTQTLSGGEDCFDCGLEVTSTTNCINEDSYNVFVNISGNGTFTVNDGINAPLTGVSSGNQILGPYANGTYNITVTSEADPNCVETLSGSEDCSEPPVCDVTASATTVCLGDEDGYEVVLSLNGTGTFTVNDGVNPPLTNQSSAAITLGPILNGAYSITITSELDTTCTIQLSGERDCAPEIPCDISAIASTNCIDTDSYELIVDLTGSSTYTLTAGANTITGATTGSINIGTLPTGAYSLTITDETDAECTVTLSGNEECTDNVDCDVTVEAIVQCINNQQYIVSITITGNSTYIIDDQQGNVTVGLGNETYEIGPFASNTTYQIEVLDEANDLCFKTVSGSKICQPGLGCNPGIVIDKQCLPDSSGYQLEVTLSGSSTYSLYDGLFIDFPNSNLLATGLQAGDTFIIGPFENSEQYNFLMIDEEDDLCFQDYIGTFDCLGGCDLEAAAFPVCNDDGTFNVEITVQGSGIYDVTGDVLETVSGGDLVSFGPYNAGDTYYFILIDQTDDNCIQDFLGTADCETQQLCDINASVDFSCFDNETYDIIFNLTGEGVFTITASNGTALTDITQADNPINLGNFSNGGYTINVQDKNNIECDAVYVGSHICSPPPPCDLVVTNNNVCVDTGNYNVELSVTGSDVYDVFSNGNLVLGNVSSGTYTVGPIPNGDYSIIVQGSEDVTCIQTIQGNFSCSDELPCDVVVTIDKECLEEGEYQLNLTVTGSGTYTISDGNTVYTTTQTAGVITVGPFANGSYDLEIVDNANDECFQNISGSFECVTCDLTANFIPECTETGGFILQLNLTGSSNYTITNNGNIIATNISAGQQEVGPIASGFYSITIQDENNASCSQTSEGTFTCEPPACDIAAILTPTCTEGNEFDMELVLTGSSTYTITGGFDTGTLTGQTAGTIDLIGIQGGGYSITIQDEIDGTCFQTYNGVFECEDEPCDLFVSSSIECDGEDFFNIILNISGSDVYEIYLFDDLIALDTSGIVILGSFEVEDADAYELTIVGQNTNCEQTITVEPDCDTEPAVCNLSLNAQPICNENGSYYFDLDLPAGTTYSIAYGPPGGGGPPPTTGIEAGVFTTIDFTNDLYGFTVTAENIADCSQQVFGTYGCSVGEPGDPECDISFSYTYECLPPDGETYNFIITIVGEGLFNVITTTAGGDCNQDLPLLLEVPEGIYVLEPTSENGCPNETVLEQIGTDCTRELFATASCTPDCLMDVFMQVECNVDGTFDVVIDIEGDDTYNIQTWDGQDLGLNGVDPGTYTVGPFTNAYDLVVYVDDFDACFYRDYKDDIECEDVTPPPCDLDATVAYTCNDDGTYFVDLFIIDGSGTYDFIIPNGGPGNPPTILGEDLGTGQHNFGPFDVNGEENLYVLTQVENINCEKLFYLSPACQADCDLSAFFLRECNDDGTFNVIVNISGSGNFSILNWPNQSIGLDSVAAGLYTAGPYEDEYDILVVDVDNPENCFFNDYGEFTECGDPPPVCNIFASVEIDCNEDDGSFFLEFTITGSDVYDIIPNTFGPGGGNNDIDFGDVFDLSAGVYTFGPFTGTAYDLLVLGSDFEPGGQGQGPPDGCFQLVSSEVDCTGEPVPCDLEISINDISCNTNNGLVELEITGTDTYTVEVEGEGTQSGVSAGVITIPVSVPNINITVTAQSNPSCFETLAGDNPCVSSVCDLVAGASVECLDNGDYNVIVDIAGSGSYTVTNDFGEEAIIDVTAGSITFGPLDVPTYQITITKDGDEECFQTITGNDQCNPIIPCDLNAITDIYCNEDGTYSIDVTITGSDIYDIYRSGTGELGTGFMLEFTTDDWPQEVFWNLINDATGEVVYSTSPGSYPTPFETYTEVMDELDPDVSYTIILFDVYGDGWTLGYGGGNFSITDLATGNIIEESIFEEGAEFEIFLGSPTSSGAGTGEDDPIIADATAGTYTVGPFTSNVYDFTIISQSDPSCALEFTGNYSCNLGNCSVSAEYTIECAEDGSGYFVLLQVRGNGSYTITDDVNPDLTNQNAGLITVGPIPNGIFDIKIFDPSNPDECYLAIGGTKNCGGGIPCDLDVQVELGCTATGIPIVTADVTITGSSVYTLDDGQGNISNGLTAGVYTINLGDSSVNYNIIVTDETEDDCNQTVSGFYTCVEPPICNINASLSFECIDDLTFNTNLSITGSSTYRIEYNGQTLNNITSDVSLGIFNNGSYTVLITDEANPSCTQTLQGNYACSAISFCDLSVAYEANCTNGDLFIDVTISGSGTYYIQDSSGFGEPIVLASGLTAGTVTVGPLAIDFDFLSMQVFNESNQDCFQNISGASSCEDGCDLFISAATECVSSTAYNIILTITGNSTYNLSDQLGNPYNGYTAGTYTFGPYTGSNYNFNVTSDDGFFCSQFISGVRECTVPNICDLNVDIAPICDDASPNSFFIDLTLSGSSSYSVIYSDGFGSTQISGLTAGNTQIGPINDGFYNIQIVDETNSECTDFYNGNYNCGESQECDLTISAVPVCNEDGSYNLEVTVEGSDTYNIFDFFTGVFLENVGAGTYEIGPLFDDFYQIGAENSGGGGFFGCSQFVSGNFNCDGDCDLSIEQEIVCNDNGTFNVEITLTGGSNYEIIDFLTGQSLSDIEEGTYTFGPYDFQSYFIFVSDLDGGCTQEISGQGSCAETGSCNLFASQTVECIDGENGYNVTLEVTGSSTYDITDIFGNLIDSNVTAGTYTYGPFYLANYQFTIFQNDDPFFNCFQQVSGVFECSPPGPCDLIVSALPNCENADLGSFGLDLTIDGSSTYTILVNGMVNSNNVSAGTFQLTEIPEGFYFIQILDELSSDCTQSLSGNYSCDGFTECDLQANVESNCISEEEYEVVVTIEGTGSYNVEINFENQGQYTAGVYTFGPFDINNGFDFYNVNVFDGSGFFGECFQSLSGSISCDPDNPCDIETDIEFVCDEDNNLFIDVIISGDGEYEILDFSTFEFQNGPAGTYTFGPIENDFYGFDISNSVSGCNESLQGNYLCEPQPVCDLYVSVVANCSEISNEYFLDISVFGSEEYEIYIGNFGSPTDVVTAGTYTYGPYTNNQYNVYAQSIDGGFFGNCFNQVFGEIECNTGGQTCNLNVTNTEFECAADDSFSLNFTITGDGTYTIDFGNGSPLTGINAGEVSVGPITTTNYTIQVIQEGNPNCSQTLSGSYECVPSEPCTLSATASTICNANGTYTLDVVITGDGSFNINANGETQTSVSAGTYSFGAFNEGSYTVEVTNPNSVGCIQTITGDVQCSPNEDCDLDFAVEPFCETVGFYSMNIIIEGSEDVYTVILNGESFFDIPSGEYFLDFVPNGEYELTVVSQENPDECFVSYFGSFQCTEEEPTCNLEANATPVCFDALTYNLQITIEGTGDYTIFYGDEAMEVTAGLYQVGPFTNGAYEIEVVGGEQCTQIINGNFNCADEPIGCNLFASFEQECISTTESDYNIIVTLTGTSTYNITGNGFTDITSATAGTYTIEGLVSENFEIQINDELLPNCFQTLSGLRQCPVAVTPTCTLSSTMDVICNEDGSVSVSVNIIGDDTYDIIGTNSGFVFAEGVAEGETILGPFNNPNITEFSLTVVDASDADCFEAVNGSVNCNDNPPPACNLNASVLASCINDELYGLAISISGTGTYTIQDGTFTDEGNPAFNFTYTSDFFPEEMSWELVNDASGAIVFNGTSNNAFETTTEVLNNLDVDATYTLNLVDSYGDGWSGGPPDSGAGEYQVTDGVGNIITEGVFIAGFELSLSLGSPSSLLPNEVTGVTAGDIELGPFNDIDYAITIFDENNPACFTTLTGTQDCSVPQQCNIQVTSSIDCLSTEEFMLMVDITTPGSYTITDGVNELLTNQTEGVIPVGPLAAGAYTITIINETDESCIRTIAGFNNCPPPVCDLIVNSDIDCLNEDSFLVTVDIAGSDTYTIEDNYGNIQNGVVAGQLFLGPYPNGAFNITITSENVAGCVEEITGIKDCSVPIECELNVNATTTCNDTGDGFILTLEITGNDTGYNIDLGETLLTSQLGIVEIPLPNGTYNVVVIAENVPACTYVIAGLQDCFGGGCAIQASSETTCIGSDESYFVNVTLNGENTYTVTDGANTVNGATSGQLLLGPLDTPTYEVSITDESDSNCAIIISGDNGCIEPPICDLALSSTTTCIGEQNYEVTVTISGSGTYIVEEAGNTQAGLTAGTYTFGPYSNGEYEVVVTSETLGSCAESITGLVDCSGEQVCEITASATVSCIDNDQYFLVIDVTGINTYTITSGDVTLIGQTGENGILFGPLSGFNYAVEIISETDETCSYILTGEAPCAVTSISNFVWEDINENGLQDIGEPGVADILVSLFGAGDDGEFGTDDDIAFSVMTDSNGAYLFDNLFAGNYYIIVDVPTTYEPTMQNAGDDEIDSDINVVGQTSIITIAEGESNNSIDAGLVSLCRNFIVTPTPVCEHPIDNMMYVSYGITGGEAPYTVTGDADFNFGDNTLIIEYTIGDTYNVTITDVNGCSTTLSEVLVGCDNLAVELLEFDGEMLESGNNLFWRTATEVNNDYFTIERSLDGVNFEAIGNVNAIGNNTVEQRYNLLDTDAPIGKAYYRLAIVDINGTVDYAQNIVILERRAAVDFNVYPNPVVNDLTIEFESAIAGANTVITIYDVSGKLITKFNHVNTAGVNKVLLSMENYAVGTYLLSFINEEQQKAVPVIKH